MEEDSFYNKGDKGSLKKVQLLSNLPEPTLIQIALELNVSEIEAIGFTASKLKGIVNTEKLWNSLLIGDFRGFSPLLDQNEIARNVNAIVARLSNTFDSSISKYKFIYACFAKMFLITPRYGFDELFTSMRMMAISESRNMLNLFPYLSSDFGTREYLSILREIGITEDDMKKLRQSGVTLLDHLSKLLRLPNSFKKGSIIKLIAYLRKTSKFASVYNMHWNGVYMSVRGFIGENAGIGNIHNYINVTENIPNHEFYDSQTNPFAIQKEEKKRLLIQYYFPMWELFGDDEHDANGSFMDPLLLISQVFTLENIPDEVNNSHLIGIKQSSDYLNNPRVNKAYESLSYFRLRDINGEYAKAVSEKENGGGPKALLAFVSGLLINMRVTSNDLSKEIRNEVYEKLKNDLDEFHMIKRDDITVADLLVYLEGKDDTTNSYSTGRKFYLDRFTESNSLNVNMRLKATKVIDTNDSPNFLFVCSLFSMDGDYAGICEVEISKNERIEDGNYGKGSLYLGSLKAANIDSFWLLRQKINIGLLDHLKSNKDRTSIYYSKPVTEEIKDKRNVSAQTVTHVKCGKKDLDFSIEEVIDIEGKENYMIYDKNNENLYCEHIHSNLEELQKHIKSDKIKDLCPKCCD
jgi:hypothetical protein